MLYTAGLASTLGLDIELQEPQDLETAIALARIFQLASIQTATPQKPSQPIPEIQISLHAATGIKTC